MAQDLDTTDFDVSGYLYTEDEVIDNNSVGTTETGSEHNDLEEIVAETDENIKVALKAQRRSPWVITITKIFANSSRKIAELAFPYVVPNNYFDISKIVRLLEADVDNVKTALENVDYYVTNNGDGHLYKLNQLGTIVSELCKRFDVGKVKKFESYIRTFYDVPVKPWQDESDLHKLKSRIINRIIELIAVKSKRIGKLETEESYLEELAISLADRIKGYSERSGIELFSEYSIKEAAKFIKADPEKAEHRLRGALVNYRIRNVKYEKGHHTEILGLDLIIYLLRYTKKTGFTEKDIAEVFGVAEVDCDRFGVTKKKGKEEYSYWSVHRVYDSVAKLAREKIVDDSFDEEDEEEPPQSHEDSTYKRDLIKKEYEDKREKYISFAYNLVRDLHIAEDLVQGVFTKLLNKPESFRYGELRNLVFTSIKNDYINMYRQRLKRKETQFSQLSEEPILMFIPDRVEKSAELNDIFEEYDDQIIKAMGIIPEEFLDILLLYEIGGMTYQEISEGLNIPKGTVMSRLFRARKELGKYLEDLYSNKPS